MTDFMKTVVDAETGVVSEVPWDDDDHAAHQADMAEAEARKAAAEAAAPHRAILAQIAILEAKETPRRLAEAVLSDAGKAWLEDNRAQIAALRSEL